MEDGQAQIAKLFLGGYKGNLLAADELAAEVEKLIDEAVKEAAKLGSTVKNPLRFAFANNASLRKRMEGIIARLSKSLTSTIEKGSRDAWTRSEDTNQRVIAALTSTNGMLAEAFAQDKATKATDRALEGWLNRKTQGLGLSERVWNLTSRLKTEMEQAIEIALAQGTPAAKLSQEIRHCLQHPDNFFRRFRYKDAAGQWRRKWKRQYVDSDGNKRWQDVDLKDYSYGPGVYRSSYKNAMRLARTEVNMAYHAADNERWMSSWWVKGIGIRLSNNHTTTDAKGKRVPLTDICDDLAGDYPSDFKFMGWHPQCRCYAYAITATTAEIREYHRRKRAGEDMSNYEVPGKIKDLPDGAKAWIRNNMPRMINAFADGKAPYFLTDNAKYTGKQFAPKTKPAATTEPKTPAAPTAETPTAEPPKRQSIQERAAARHAARTEEDIERIQLAWDAHRRQEYETRMQNQLSLAEYDKIKTDLYDVDCGMFGDHDNNRRILDEMRRKLDVHKSNLDIWNDLLLTTPNKRKDAIPPIGSLDFFDESTGTILRAAKRHAARTDKEIATIRKAWNLHRIEDGKRILAGTPTSGQALAAKLKISDATIRNFDKAKEITDYLTKQYPGIGIHMDGMDIETIRQFALSADSHFIRFPALTSKFKQLGSIGWQYDVIVQKELDKRVADRIAMHNSSKAVLTGRKAPIKDLDKATKDKIRASIESEKAFISRSPTGNKDTYAFSDPWSKYDTNGIYWNESHTFKKATDLVKKDVASKFHPEGCDSVRAIFDHEFGHKVDEYLGLRTNAEFIKIYDDAVAKGKTWVEDHLSRYAWKGADPKAEFIAEAWSEYVCSPKPRPIAKKIGELIEKLAAAKTP